MAEPQPWVITHGRQTNHTELRSGDITQPRVSTHGLNDKKEKGSPIDVSASLFRVKRKIKSSAKRSVFALSFKLLAIIMHSAL